MVVDKAKGGGVWPDPPASNRVNYETIETHGRAFLKLNISSIFYRHCDLIVTKNVNQFRVGN